MTKLLEKGKTFEWRPRREASFQELKKRLTTTPVLTMPDMENSFSIYCDASGQGLGCVLMQDGHVVTYASRQLRKHKEVPDPRLGISSCGTCFKNMEVLYHW
jgi:hypothetical protein